MTRQEEFKPRVPSIRELVEWHNRFGRMFKTNERRTKLFGVDGKKVSFTERSKPEYVTLIERDSDGKLLDTPHGYSSVRKRADGSECWFRLADLGSEINVYLTYAECDLVLGSNYYLIDQSYSSPGPFIRKVLFKADQGRADKYNAFEIGTPVSCVDITIPVIYYRIPQQRFRKLRDYQTNLDALVEAVKAERAE